MSTPAIEAAPLLVARGLTHEYRKPNLLSGTVSAVQAFAEVDLVVRRESTLAIVGESGAGKSSLARCLALLERPMKGEILFEGQNLLDLNDRELFPFRRAIQLVFQDPTSSLNPRLTAAEIIAEPLVVQHAGTPAQQRQRVLELMDGVRLPAKWREKRPLEFSGGQRQRLAVARALALKPRLIIFDEALSSVDLENQESILEYLASLRNEQPLTCVHISHDLSLVSKIADEIAVMYKGRIVEQKSALQLLESQDDPYTQELFAMRTSVESILTARYAEVPR